jgi:hypothetical protein
MCVTANHSMQLRLRVYPPEAAFLDKNLHHPVGLTVPSISVQAAGAWNKAQPAGVFTSPAFGNDL